MSEHAITRRSLLAGIAVAPILAARSRAKAEANIEVALEETVGTINPALQSHFAEHIGGVIYDGIWVGADSKISNVGGIRKALIDHVKRLGPVVVRWPGGCFADRYHWRDGIGPPTNRPRRFGRWREETESNRFGTHEFIRFCRLTGKTPYLAANVGTGSAEEFQDWVEYCNAPAGRTTLADERVSNGDRDPFGVRYWGVGNESWGCGGKFTPEDYCREYRRFTEWVPSYGVPLFLIAAGPNGDDVEWTRRFFKKWSDYAKAPIQGWAPHYYCGTTGHALKFNRDQWHEQLHKAARMETLIERQWKALEEFDPQRRIRLIVDEWGSWHPEGTEINKRHLYEQMGTLRDALVASLTLDIFNRHAEKMGMANVAQLVNNLHSLFLADEDKFVATPTFHVFEMYKPHQGGTSARLAVEADELSFRAGGRDLKLFRVAGSASIKEKTLTITLTHAHPESSLETSIRLKGGSASTCEGWTLTHERLNAHNTFESPDAVVPKPSKVEAKGSELRLTLPPASVTRVSAKLA